MVRGLSSADELPAAALPLSLYNWQGMVYNYRRIAQTNLIASLHSDFLTTYVWLCNILTQLKLFNPIKTLSFV